MSKIRIIGIGTSFGYDKVGLEVIDECQKATFPDHVELIKSSRPIDLLDYFLDTNTVYLIDAVQSDASVGTIHELKHLEQILEQANEQFLSSHDLSVLHVLSLAKSLNLLPQTIMFYGIEVGEGELSSHQLAQIKSAQQQLASRLHRAVAKL